jgi:hypothetical protein
MLFMAIERFKGRDAKAVYRRLREQGARRARRAALQGQLGRGQFRALLPADGLR